MNCLWIKTFQATAMAQRGSVHWTYDWRVWDNDIDNRKPEQYWTCQLSWLLWLSCNCLLSAHCSSPHQQLIDPRTKPSPVLHLCNKKLSRYFGADTRYAGGYGSATPQPCGRPRHYCRQGSRSHQQAGRRQQTSWWYRLLISGPTLTERLSNMQVAARDKCKIQTISVQNVVCTFNTSFIQTFFAEE